MVALGALGMLETSYLTLSKLLSSDATCAARGCSQVLNSAFANVHGVPLSLFGAVAYAGVTLLGARRLQNRRHHHRHRRRRRHRHRLESDALLGLASAMATCSAYLMLLLAFELRAACPWCLASAGISFALFALTAYDARVARVKRAAAVAGAAALVAASASLGSYAAVQMGAAAGAAAASGAPPVPAELVRSPPPVRTHSSARALALAKLLRENDARMYGAYWCEHCREQKEMLGAEAFAYIDYRECSKYGADSHMMTCRKRRVPGYPTWEIRGRLYPGEHTLEQLARIVGVERLDDMVPRE